MPPCGGAPSRNARSKWPNKYLLIFVADAEHAEHFLLQIRFVNPNAAAADLDAIQDNVVSFGAHFAEFLLVEQRHIFRFRSGKRMMHRVPFIFLGAPLQERKIGHPKKIELL